MTAVPLRGALACRQLVAIDFDVGRDIKIC